MEALDRFWDVARGLLSPDLARPSVKLSSRGLNARRWLFSAVPSATDAPRSVVELAERLGLPVGGGAVFADAARKATSYLGGIDVDGEQVRTKVYVEHDAGPRAPGDPVHVAFKWRTDHEAVEVATYVWRPPGDVEAEVRAACGPTPHLAEAVLGSSLLARRPRGDQAVLRAHSAEGRRSVDVMVAHVGLDLRHALDALAPACALIGVPDVATDLLDADALGARVVRLVAGTDPGGEPFLSLYHRPM